MNSLAAVALLMLTQFFANATDLPDKNDLLAAPTEVSINGVAIPVNVSIWIDRLPGPEPFQRPICAIVIPNDDAVLPADLRIDAIAVIKGDEIWVPQIIEDQTMIRGGFLTLAIRNGPKWGSGSKVEILVRLTHSRYSPQWLRIPEQIQSVM